MRGRLEPRLGLYAAAWEEPDGVGIHVPGDRVGGVAGVLVLGEEADERRPERREQRREDKRERGLRDACVRRERVGERAEALARGKLIDESAERGPVHAFGGEHAPRRHRSDQPKPFCEADPGFVCGPQQAAVDAARGGGGPGRRPADSSMS